MDINRSMIEEIARCVDESGINRVKKWLDERECAIVSGSRDVLKDVHAGDSVIDVGIKETEVIDERGVKHKMVTDGSVRMITSDELDGKELTTSDNINRSRLLKDRLLRLGYGVTDQIGRFEGKKERSFLVVNLNDDQDFEKKITDLAKCFNQDSFIHKPKGSDEAFYVGTNDRVDPPFSPGYGRKASAGSFNVKIGEGFRTTVRNGGYVFEGLETFGRNSPLAQSFIASRSRKLEEAMERAGHRRP